MKRRIGFILILTLVISVLASGCGSSKPSINVYNWGDYIEPEVLRMFEEEYGVKVVYDTYATNEDLYIKLKQGGSSYDVIIPSDYMIERMIKEDLLAKINMDNIDQLSNVDEKLHGA